MIALPAALLLAADTPTPALLDPKAGLFFWTLVVFLIVLLVLRRYAWGPITRALQERETTINASIQRAEDALAEAKQIAADNEQARREAEVQAQRILRDARETAEQLRSEERDKTRQELQLMRDQARAEIEQEKQNALSALRAEVADLAIQAAERVLDANLDASANRRIVESFIDGLPKN